jgi:hypothetical protein
MHCKEISIYVFPEKELRALSHNFHIHVSVSDLYIPTSVPPTVLSFSRIGRKIREYINRSQKHECRNWDCSRAVPFLGIFISNFQYCVFAVCTQAAAFGRNATIS